jgi:hypothetical protein
MGCNATCLRYRGIAPQVINLGICHPIRGWDTGFSLRNGSFGYGRAVSHRAANGRGRPEDTGRSVPHIIGGTGSVSSLSYFQPKTMSSSRFLRSSTLPLEAYAPNASLGRRVLYDVTNQTSKSERRRAEAHGSGKLGERGHEPPASQHFQAHAIVTMA